MIILGIILLVCGIIFGIPILNTIGIIFMLVGAALWLLGTTWRPIGGRTHYY
ncbi:hypothetical protein [Nocardia terpenica]|uniref:hypothetical protein n=1 Tax=Nocardia terpenica TaxID=455432 RepID=UPI00142E4D60|nr:hypothetical protein [Nocardia terpenica]